MNSSSITGSASPLTPQFETVRPMSEPSVPEIHETDELETELGDDEREAGLQRLASLIKRKLSERHPKRSRGLELYEKNKNFGDESVRGALIDKVR